MRTIYQDPEYRVTYWDEQQQDYVSYGVYDTQDEAADVVADLEGDPDYPNVGWVMLQHQELV